MAESKWVRGLGPATGLTEAARQVLRARLQVVGECLPRAAREAHLDPEHVHQLRVATRRADAALRIFRPCFPRGAYRSTRSRLRRLRRAAGAARDWDVFLIALRERLKSARPEQVPGLDFLIGHALARREAAQADLESAVAAQPESFEEFIGAVLDEVRPAEPGTPSTLGELARSVLTTRLERLEQAAGGNLKDYAQLHEVRIAGKRLRYAMEVLGDCFGPAFKDRLYPMVEEVQEVLGRANDSHVAACRLEALRAQLAAWPQTWGRVKAGVEALLRFHQRRLPQERRRFLEWWQRWRQAGADEVVAGSR
jgi:CHAD domain-containing protein